MDHTADDETSERRRQWFRTFAEVECPDLPLYRHLCTAIADDNDVLTLLATAQPGQWRPNLLLAAAHFLVMRHPDDEFSRFYPTVGGSFADGTDAMPLFRKFTSDHLDELSELIATRATQTNEVNRSCLWFASVRHAASDLPNMPIALIEIGASAGLNLKFDQYGYTFARGPESASVGKSESDVQLQCEVRGAGIPPFAAELPPIGSRVGLDAHPVDLESDDLLWLKACIWPEQTLRHQRFDAAVSMLRTSQPHIVVDDAVDGIADLIESIPDDHHIIVISSWVQAYLRRDRRAALDAAVDLAATERDVSWISAEGDGVAAWVPRPSADPDDFTQVGLATWRHGRSDQRQNTLIARCHAHLAWIEWRA